MQIRVPEQEKMGGTLKVLPGGPYTATVKDIIIGESKTSKQPKATLRWIITSEPEDGDKAFKGMKDPQGKKIEPFPTTGETVLDTYSLQEQAIWRLNDTHKTLTGQGLPQGDYDETELGNLLTENLVGQDALLILTIEPDQQGNDRTKVESVGK